MNKRELTGKAMFAQSDIPKLNAEELAILVGSARQISRGKFTVTLDNEFGGIDPTTQQPVPAKGKRIFLIGGVGAMATFLTGGDYSQKGLERFDSPHKVLPTDTTLEGGAYALPALIATHQVLVKGMSYVVNNEKQFSSPIKVVTVTPFGSKTEKDISAEILDASSSAYTNNQRVLKLDNFHFELNNMKALAIEVQAGVKATITFDATFIAK